MSSVRSEGRIRFQKLRDLILKRFVPLEERAVARVGIGQEYRIRQVLLQPVGIADRNHFVVNAIHHERRLRDALQIRKTIATELLPLAKGRHLRAGHDWTGRWIAVFSPQCDSANECFAGGLTHIGEREEDLLQDRIALQVRVIELGGQSRFVQVHDVLATARRRANEDHPSKDRRPIQHHLLCDHAAE